MEQPNPRELFKVAVNDSSALHRYVDTFLGCMHPGSSVLQSQAARAGYLLILGADLPAAENFVRPATGAVIEAPVLCDRMHRKLESPRISAKKATAQRIAKSIVNALNFARAGVSFVPSVLISFGLTAEAVAHLVSALAFGWGAPAIALPIVAAGAFRPLQAVYGVLSGSNDTAEQLAKKPEKAVEVFAEDVQFPDGMTGDDLQARFLFERHLRQLDVDVYKLQRQSPEDLLQWMATNAVAPMTAWQAAATAMLRHYGACGQEMSVEATRCMRKELVSDPTTKTLYRTSMVFDSSGRLRSNADMARAFYQTWLSEHKLLTERLRGTAVAGAGGVLGDARRAVRDALRNAYQAAHQAARRPRFARERSLLRSAYRARSPSPVFEDALSRSPLPGGREMLEGVRRGRSLVRSAYRARYPSPVFEDALSHSPLPGGREMLEGVRRGRSPSRRGPAVAD
jgi:hypothetical protein